MGDGDCAAIGGNHFIHAARRNLDVTALVINNQIYGMTGGQYSPDHPGGLHGHHGPIRGRGARVRPVRPCPVCWATFVGRVAPVRMPELINTFAKALQHRGFSFVEAVSQCPIYFGRMNKQGGPVEMLQRQKAITVPLRQAQKDPEGMEGKLLTGVLYESDRPAYQDLYGRFG